MEEELAFFKNNQESQFSQFEQKFKVLSDELDSTKNENSHLRQTENKLRSKISHITNERNDLLNQLENVENIDVSFI